VLLAARPYLMNVRRFLRAALDSTSGESVALVRAVRQAARDLNVFLGVPIGSDELAAARRAARARLREFRRERGERPATAQLGA
jgi:hypothetical protein